AAGPVVSNHRSGHHCRRPRHGGAAAAGSRPADGPRLAGHARVLRRRLRDDLAVDLRTRDDRLAMNNRLFTPLAIVTAAMFAYAPFMVLGAPYESTMGL